MVSILTMENSDYLLVDGRQLRILLTIQKAGSLSGAARMLDMNQSTISYWLDLLRERAKDPLFVRAGNGVEPTERARALFAEAEAALRHMQAMFDPPDYDPVTDTGVFRIAATAAERSFAVQPFMTRAQEVAPAMSIEIHRPGSPYQTMESLRAGTIDVGFMPLNTMEADGIQRRKIASFADTVFYDPDFPFEAGSLDAYCARPHVRVVLGPDASFSIDRRLAKLGRKRHVRLQVSDFDSALTLIQGTPLIATLPNVLEPVGLSRAAPPWDQNVVDLGLYWHIRNQTSPRHTFWRNVLAEVASAGARSR